MKENLARENDLFGRHIPSTYYNGLFDANKVGEFDAKVQLLKAVWDKVDPEFDPWLVKMQRDTFIECLIAPVRELAGARYDHMQEVHTLLTIMRASTGSSRSSPVVRGASDQSSMCK